MDRFPHCPPRASKQTAEHDRICNCFDGPPNSDTVSHDLAMALGCPRPQEHSLRLGSGRRHLPDCVDHCRTVGAPGVFIVPLKKEFGWTTAEISSALSIRFIL